MCAINCRMHIALWDALRTLAHVQVLQSKASQTTGINCSRCRHLDRQVSQSRHGETYDVYTVMLMMHALCTPPASRARSSSQCLCNYAFHVQAQYGGDRATLHHGHASIRGTVQRDDRQQNWTQDALECRGETRLNTYALSVHRALRLNETRTYFCRRSLLISGCALAHTCWAKHLRLGNAAHARQPHFHDCKEICLGHCLAPAEVCNEEHTVCSCALLQLKAALDQRRRLSRLLCSGAPV